jgi:hypothetical protein
MGLIRFGAEWNMFHLKHPYNDLNGWQNNVLKRQNAERFSGVKVL